MISAVAGVIGPEIFVRTAAESIVWTAAEDFCLVCVSGRVGLGPGVTILALQQYGDARCGAPTAGDWGQQIASEAWPGKGHSNNLKCMASGLKVSSCYAAAMMFTMK